ALLRNTRQRVAAVGSRRTEASQAFAERFDIDRWHVGYEALVSDPNVDIIYVATPHTSHFEHAMLALQAGKHVLVEKPLATNAADAVTLTTEARSRGLFCAEAFWTFHLPKFDVLRQLRDDGVIGEINTTIADIGEHFTLDHRIFNPALGGGPLLDLGVYALSLTSWFLGAGLDLTAHGQPHPSGVLQQISISLRDAGLNQGVVHTTLANHTPTQAFVGGTAGSIRIDGAFYQPGAFTLSDVTGSRSLRYEEPAVGHAALYYEAAEAARAVSEGRLESAYWSQAESLEVARLIDLTVASTAAHTATQEKP
ncbi:MAG: Gfo/Idh/MocA family protein, partial [Leucobacter sp.]